MAFLKTSLMILFFNAIIAFHQDVVDATISKSMYMNWGAHHSVITGDDLQLVLDQYSGSGAQSKRAFLFGNIEMLIKLVPGNSAGTVTAYYFPNKNAQSKRAFLFGNIEMLIKLVPGNSAGTVTVYYLSSTGSKHDEIDFEFLGNVSGQPFIIHTNIYTQGNGNREQQFYPWFDPTADFHNYTIHWNPTEVVWYVDSLPIRVFRNYENEGITYPNKQGMRAYTSLWNADNWATRGGLVKIDWKSAPFITRLSKFRARACKWDGPVSASLCASKTLANWWTSPVYSRLSDAKVGQLKWVRDNHMIYDYCKDTKRFNGHLPPECFKQQF